MTHSIKQSRLFKSGLALLAGALLVTGFEPFNFPFAAFLALLGLLVLLKTATPRDAWRLGFLFGAGMFGVGISWVYISIHEYGHTPLVLAVFLTLLLIAYLSLFPALFAWLVARFKIRENPRLFLFMVPALWTLSEWLRGTLLTGFPWLNIGYSQIDTWLAAYAPVLGVYGIGFLMMLSVTAVLGFFRHKILSTVVLLAVGISSWQMSSIEWTTPAGQPVEVSLIQGNVSQLDKFEPENRARIMTLYETLTLENLDSDLIIWPETAVPAFYHRVAKNYIGDILEHARKTNTDLLIGVPIKKETEDSDRPRYYNSAVALGQNFGVYSKHHLVPFGEVVPFGNLLRRIGGIFNVPLSDFSSGGIQPPLALAGQKAAISICYEIVFGEELAETAGASTMLINISNDAWFGDSLAPGQHFSMARMRVRETARPLLRATNTGITAFVDHKARVIAQAPSFSVQVLKHSVQPMQGETLYLRFGNKLILFVVVLVLIVGGIVLRYYQQSNKNNLY